MKFFDWSEQKNSLLKRHRRVSFEDVLVSIEDNRILDLLEHPNPKKYPHQRIFIVQIGDYAYLVPFVEDDHKIFLKTIIPSRQATKKYLNNK